MEEADQEGTAAQPDEVDVRGAGDPRCRDAVAMGQAAVGVLVARDEDPAEGAEEHVAAQEDEDQADGPLQRLLEPGSDRELEPDDGDAGAQEGERVAGTQNAPRRHDRASPRSRATSVETAAT